MAKIFKYPQLEKGSSLMICNRKAHIEVCFRAYEFSAASKQPK